MVNRIVFPEKYRLVSLFIFLTHKGNLQANMMLNRKPTQLKPLTFILLLGNETILFSHLNFQQTLTNSTTSKTT